MDYENFEGKFYAKYTAGCDKQLRRSWLFFPYSIIRQNIANHRCQNTINKIGLLACDERRSRSFQFDPIRFSSKILRHA